MLRLATEDGWWLVTHADHAALAGDFAAAWGNDRFVAPAPRDHVLRGIRTHDDGWRARDAEPLITAAGEPAAFSRELVGRYSAFEEIDLAAYLAVRRSAVALVAARDPYAAILISMHTVNLLTERADRSTIRPEQLPLLDGFLAEQNTLQLALRTELAQPPGAADITVNPASLTRNFLLLQACDNLSLLSCTDFPHAATLLHPLATHTHGPQPVATSRAGERHFRLAPYPFLTPDLTFQLKARFVPGRRFGSHADLQARFHAAPEQELPVRVSP